jgi:hypothetical protein
MKKVLSISAIALTLTVAQAVFAQEEGEMDLKPDWRKDFSVTIGTKVWVNEWQLDRFFTETTAPFFLGITNIEGTTTNDAPDTQISDIEPTPIPQLAVRYKQLFITGSYYVKTDFDFPTVRQSGRTTLSELDALGNLIPTFLIERTLFTTTTGERWEWDAAVGWYVHPYVALLVGYKEINVETGGTVTGTDTFTDLSTGEVLPQPPPTPLTFFTEIEISGPTLGIAGSVPIVHGFGIYASYAHGFMDVDIGEGTVSPTFSEASTELDADYDVAELGFSYTPNMAALLLHLPLSAATIYAGYRYQTIETDTPDDLGGDRRDITQGFVAGLNLTF